MINCSYYIFCAVLQHRLERLKVNCLENVILTYVFSEMLKLIRPPVDF